MKILFIRHGQTQLNAEGRWLGSDGLVLQMLHYLKQEKKF